MIQLVEKDYCTGCGACAFVCPKHCITMDPDEKGIILPKINYVKCIECGRCLKTCPILSPVEFHEPQKAFAAWSLDDDERRTSASGGIAAEIYKYALKKGFLIAGAVQQTEFSVKLELSDNASVLPAFKNSKYVFSSALELYGQISNAIKEGHKCVIIGLPCQIAAIRKIFKDNDCLFLADVVCHGTTPQTYLKQHVEYLENKLLKKATKMSFRDSTVTETDTFTFSLYDEQGKCFYAESDISGKDEYNFGYHRQVTYRENCYSCPFAQSKRVSDLTLSDYKGLGKLKSCSLENRKVSSVLVNTDKGDNILSILSGNNCIIAEERPVQEPIMGDPQLQHPSIRNKYYKMFQRSIGQGHVDFDNIIRPLMLKYWRAKRRKVLFVRIKKYIKKILMYDIMRSMYNKRLD